MERFDAIIIGGGPAGSTCAWQLKRLGLNPLILDKKVFPRDKPCAGWITPQVIESLELNIDEYRPGRTWEPLCGFRCGTIGGKLVGVDYGKPVSYGILRTEFDEYLLRRSAAHLRLGESATEFEQEDGEWVINRRYAAPILVGAGGNFCPVARRLGAENKTNIPQVVAQEVEFKAPRENSRVGDDRPALYFCSDLLGYGWCFRKGEYLNIGLGRTNKLGFAQHLDEFREFLNAREVTVSEKSGKWRGHAYRLFARTAPTLVDGNTLLIGDAAGLADLRSGEGIRCAIESAIMAAESIATALHARQGAAVDGNELSTYSQKLLTRFGKPPEASTGSWLPASWFEAISGQLLKNRWFAQNYVLDKWFLHRSLPAYRAQVPANTHREAVLS